jgi:hypothetical protein
VGIAIGKDLKRPRQIELADAVKSDQRAGVRDDEPALR